MQLSMFAPQVEPKAEYPWASVFPEWMPQLGGVAQMGAVILPNKGYCYGDRVRISYLDGETVTCFVEHAADADWWKNATIYNCTVHDLWPTQEAIA